MVMNTYTDEIRRLLPLARRLSRIQQTTTKIQMYKSHFQPAAEYAALQIALAPKTYLKYYDQAACKNLKVLLKLPIHFSTTNLLRELNLTRPSDRLKAMAETFTSKCLNHPDEMIQTIVAPSQYRDRR